MTIRRIRRAIRDGRYEFTSHALDEMDEDDLLAADIQSVILHGHVSKEPTDDPRGSRYVIHGAPARGRAQVEVVCRFLPSGRMRIITVYTLED